MIVTVDDKTGAEQMEGTIDEWDTTEDGQNVGKTEVIEKLKEILRGKADTKL